MVITEILVAALCLSVGLSDIQARRIPNIFTLGSCLVALFWLLINGHSVLNASLQSVAIGIILSLVLTVPGYVTRQVGAADIKWILALSLIGGWLMVIAAFVIASMISVAFYIVQLNLIRIRGNAQKRKRWIPFGTALSIGFLFAMMLLR